MVFFLGVLGKSNGKGFYVHEKGSKPKPDPSVLPIVDESRKLMNIMPGGKVFSLLFFFKRKLYDMKFSTLGGSFLSWKHSV